jgi:hypothetical protein
VVAPAQTEIFPFEVEKLPHANQRSAYLAIGLRAQNYVFYDNSATGPKQFTRREAEDRIAPA